MKKDVDDFNNAKIVSNRDDWSLKRLSEISEFITKGATPTTYGFQWSEDGILFLKSDCVSDNGFIEGEKLYITEDANEYMSRSKVRNGDILISITGNIGRVALIPQHIEEANINQHIARIRVSSKDVSNKYIYYQLSRSDVKKNYDKIKTGLAYPQISLEQVRNTKVAIPSIEEQNKIVEILSTWDLAIEKQEQLIEKKKELKKGLMQRLLSGEVRLSGFNDEWKQVKLGSTIDVIKKEALPNPQDYNLLTVKLHVKGIEKTDKKPNATEKGRPYYLRMPGELLIGRQNFHNGGIGIVPSEMKGYIASNAITSLQVINGDLQFYFYYLSNPSFYKRVDNIIGGTGQKEISETTLKKLNVKVPVSIDEQKQIARIIGVANTEVELLEKELELLKLQKKGLMQRLLTGEVRVKV
ncbi:MAG: restriction endonuclease subunit S [Clostridium celatum]|nr:restriction endonuclease subunit S [Clostridium celatum]MDU7076083.1 restriction endonuclease subunit S [Clostridium celatum]